MLCLLVCFKLHSAHCTDLVGRKNGCNGVSSNGGHHVNQGHAHPADGLERAKSTGGKKTGSGCDKGEEKWETCIPPKTPTKTHTRHTHSHTHTLSHSHTHTLTHTHSLSHAFERHAEGELREQKDEMVHDAHGHKRRNDEAVPLVWDVLLGEDTQLADGIEAVCFLARHCVVLVVPAKKVALALTTTPNSSPEQEE